MPFTERQREIITTALSIIADSGIQSLSIRNVADRVGISEPAIYRHFKNKDDLLLALTRYIVFDWENVVRRAWSADASALDGLGRVLEEVVNSCTENRMIAAASYSLQLLQKDKPVLKKVFSITELATVRTEEILLRGQKHGSVRKDIPARELAAIIFGALRLLIERWNLSGHSLDITGEWDSLWGALKVMIAPG